jgi:hypothetical protein
MRFARPACCRPFLRTCLLLALLASPLCAAEKVSIRINGQATECDVLKVTKDGAVLKTFGKELTFPLEKLDPKDVARCYKALPPPANAVTRLDMGAYFLAKHLLAEAEEEITAAQADAACKDKAAPMLIAIKVLKEVEAKAKEPGKDSGAKKPDAAQPPDEAPDGLVEGEDQTAGFKVKDVPPRSPAEMKAFLDKRLAELKTLGGAWNMKETKHFYCFTDLT